MRTWVRRPLVVACLVVAAVLAGYRSALQAQGRPARPAGGPAPTAPGFGGGFAVEEKPAAKPIATVYLTAPMTAAAARTWIKLEEPTTFPFENETPLEDALKFLADASTGKDKKPVQFYVDPVALSEAERTMAAPVTLKLEDVPISTGLTLLLKQHDLTYSVQKDGIVVITNRGSEGAVADPSTRLLEEITALRLEVDEMRKQLGLRSSR